MILAHQHLASWLNKWTLFLNLPSGDNINVPCLSWSGIRSYQLISTALLLPITPCTTGPGAGG